MFRQRTIEFDNPDFKRLSPAEQTEFLTRCNADPAFAELEAAAKRRWAWADARWLFASIAVALVVAYFSALNNADSWVFVACAAALSAGWYLGEWLLWHRWVVNRSLEVWAKVIPREFDKLSKRDEPDSNGHG